MLLVLMHFAQIISPALLGMHMLFCIFYANAVYFPNPPAVQWRNDTSVFRRWASVFPAKTSKPIVIMYNLRIRLLDVVYEINKHWIFMQESLTFIGLGCIIGA